MMTTRRLPLGEKKQIVGAADKMGKKNKSSMRKEAELELKEWQEKRDALREQKKKGQLKPFYAGSRNLKPSLKRVNKTGITTTAQNQQKQATQAKGRKITKKQPEDVKNMTEVEKTFGQLAKQKNLPKLAQGEEWTEVSDAPKSQEVQHFKDLREGSVVLLTKHCEVWGRKADELSRDVQQIRTAVGQAELLVSQNLKQFLGLCQNAEEDTGERRTTLDDLQGFWDTISDQIDDVQYKFRRLEVLQWVKERDVPKRKPLKRLQGSAKRKAIFEEMKRRMSVQRKKKAAGLSNRLKEMEGAAERGILVNSSCEPLDLKYQ